MHWDHGLFHDKLRGNGDIYACIDHFPPTRHALHPAFGFALGWNYWFNWAVTLAVEIAAAAIIMKFWLPDVPSLLWSALFLGIVFTLNALSIKSYGESEYWFALIKVVAIIFFIIIGLLTIFRGFWRKGDRVRKLHHG